MSTNYTGNPGNVTTPLTATIAGCASGASSRVRVQTTAAHNFSTNDYVQVTGVTGTTEANTTAQINVIDSTHFDMIGTTFVNPYTGGPGTATDLSLTPYGQFADNGEAGTVDSIEAFLEMLADRTQFLQKQGRVLGVSVVTSTATLVAPLGATYAIVDAYGGGGSGGGGASAGTSNTEYPIGGGGGGGAERRTRLIPVTALASYVVNIGAGGAEPGPDTTGNDGADTTFVGPGPVTLGTWRGACGGFMGLVTTTANSYMLGGGPVAPQANAAMGYNAYGVSSNATVLPGSSNFAYLRQPSEGGIGMSNACTVIPGAAIGMRNPCGGDGAAAGTSAGNAGGYHGGGGGGGGGGGPGGNGGAGGNGGLANVGSGFTGVGDQGVDAAANSGAGGGGGGAGGSNSINRGGGNGGAGGSGKAIVYWLR